MRYLKLKNDIFTYLIRFTRYLILKITITVRLERSAVTFQGRSLNVATLRRKIEGTLPWEAFVKLASNIQGTRPEGSSESFILNLFLIRMYYTILYINNSEFCENRKKLLRSPMCHRKLLSNGSS